MMRRKTCFLSIIVLFVLFASQFVVQAEVSSTMWIQTYGGDGYDIAEEVIQTSDGGYALAGTQMLIADDAPAGSYAWLIKTDSEGNIPEFPSWTIVPLVVATTLIAIYFKKKTVNKSTV